MFFVECLGYNGNMTEDNKPEYVLFVLIHKYCKYNIFIYIVIAIHLIKLLFFRCLLKNLFV